MDNGIEQNEEYTYEYSEFERNHAAILEQICVPCRSNKKGTTFTDRTRLDVIENLLETSPYHKIYEGNQCVIYSKVPLNQMTDEMVLVSSHCDIVSEITEPFSELKEDSCLYKGTYDNASTNAAITILMKEENFPDNVVFAFTGDEETGRCAGAMEAAAFLSKAQKRPFCIALDVTYEGYNKNRLITVENFVPATSSINMQETMDAIGSMLMDLEPENRTFSLIPLIKQYSPQTIPNEYIESSGMEDEAWSYKKAGYPTMSLCLPTDGSMHSNRGLWVKQPVFEGYLLSLHSIVTTLALNIRELFFNKTISHIPYLEAQKIARNSLVEKAAAVAFPKNNQYSYNSNLSYYEGFVPDYYTMFDNDVDEDMLAQMEFFNSLEPPETDYLSLFTDEKDIVILDQLQMNYEDFRSYNYGVGPLDFETFKDISEVCFTNRMYKNLGIKNPKKLTDKEEQIINDFLYELYYDINSIDTDMLSEIEDSETAHFTQDFDDISGQMAFNFENDDFYCGLNFTTPDDYGDNR